MPEKQTEKEIVDIPVAKLRPHPLQKKIYGQRSEWEIRELAESMAKNGQEEPVEILPGGKIIAGHGRVDAAKLLGWQTVRCWVRQDLKAAGPEAVEARLIETNLYRRQLSRLEMVSSYRHLKRIARDERGHQAHENKVKGDLRDMIAKRFGVSGRTLDRWLQVLDLPLPIQLAVDDGRLPLTQAVKIAVLGADASYQLKSRLEAGEDPMAVVQAFLPKGQKRHVKTIDAVAAFVRALRRGLHDFDGRVENVRPAHVAPHLADLEQAAALLQQLLAKGREAPPKDLQKAAAAIKGLHGKSKR
jgi:ParB/RepB/Spo0J family partition protein